MSEGELKRRIQLHEGTGRVLHSRLVEDWVDEVGKDFQAAIGKDFLSKFTPEIISEIEKEFGQERSINSALNKVCLAYWKWFGTKAE